VIGWGHRVKSVRVGSGRVGSRVKGFRPASVSELQICCWIVHTLHMHCGDGSSLTNAKKNKIRKLWPPPLHDDFRKCAYLCMAKRGLCFSWSHCLCLHCFSHLKIHYADTHKKSNHGLISYRFRDKQRFPSKIAKFSHHHVFCAPAERVPLVIGYRRLEPKKTKSRPTGATGPRK